MGGGEGAEERGLIPVRGLILLPTRNQLETLARAPSHLYTENRPIRNESRRTTS